MAEDREFGFAAGLRGALFRRSNGLIDFREGALFDDDAVTAQYHHDLGAPQDVIEWAASLYNQFPHRDRHLGENNNLGEFVLRANLPHGYDDMASYLDAIGTGRRQVLWAFVCLIIHTIATCHLVAAMSDDETIVRLPNPSVWIQTAQKTQRRAGVLYNILRQWNQRQFRTLSTGIHQFNAPKFAERLRVAYGLVAAFIDRVDRVISESKQVSNAYLQTELPPELADKIMGYVFKTQARSRAKPKPKLATKKKKVVKAKPKTATRKAPRQPRKKA